MRRLHLAGPVAIATVSALGCFSDGVAPPAFDNSPLPPFVGFSWVIDQQLAGMPRPSNAELAFLASEQIHRLISMTEAPLNPAALAKNEIEAVHVPVPDFTAPTLDQLLEIVATVSEWLENDRPSGVHDDAGLGRCGTALAAYFVWQGMTASEAIAEIRRLRPGSIETSAQEQAVHDFGQYLVENPDLDIAQFSSADE